MLVINKKTKYGFINLTNTVIIAPDMTLRAYKYRQKEKKIVSNINRKLDIRERCRLVIHRKYTTHVQVF
jgi:hypothetical protein